MMSIGINVSGGFRGEGGAPKRSHPPLKKNVRFFPAKRIEKRAYSTSNTSQNVFFPYDRTPLREIAPPFQNPRSATD